MTAADRLKCDRHCLRFILTSRVRSSKIDPNPWCKQGVFVVTYRSEGS